MKSCHDHPVVYEVKLVSMWVSEEQICYFPDHACLSFVATVPHFVLFTTLHSQHFPTPRFSLTVTKTVVYNFQIEMQTKNHMFLLSDVSDPEN